jgi:hypothetical protein
MHHSDDQRYSLYEAVYSPTETLMDVAAIGSGNYNQRGQAVDDTIGAAEPGTGKRLQPFVLVAEVGIDGRNVPQLRCDWEKAWRFGRA